MYFLYLSLISTSYSCAHLIILATPCNNAVPHKATECQCDFRKWRQMAADCRLNCSVGHQVNTDVNFRMNRLILQYHSVGEKNVSWHLLFTLSRTVQFVPEVEHTALEKVRATKQQNETLQETSFAWGNFNSLYTLLLQFKI